MLFSIEIRSSRKGSIESCYLWCKIKMQWRVFGIDNFSGRFMLSKRCLGIEKSLDVIVTKNI